MDGSVHYIAAIVILGEITNPLMHMRQVWTFMGNRETFLSEFMDNIFFFCYYTCRFVGGNTLIFYGAYCSELSWLVYSLLCVMVLFSVKEAIQMAKVVGQRSAARKERNAKKIPFYWFEPTPKSVLETCEFWQKAQKNKRKLN